MKGHEHHNCPTLQWTPELPNSCGKDVGEVKKIGERKVTINVEKSEKGTNTKKQIHDNTLLYIKVRYFLYFTCCHASTITCIYQGTCNISPKIVHVFLWLRQILANLPCISWRNGNTVQLFQWLYFRLRSEKLLLWQKQENCQQCFILYISLLYDDYKKPLHQKVQ